VQPVTPASLQPGPGIGRMKSTQVVADGLAFPECPRWRPDGLWFSDQHGGQIWRIGPDGTAEAMAGVPGGPSGLGWLPDGTLLAVSMHEKKLFAVTFGGAGSGASDGGADLTVVADLEPYNPGLSNDMVVDAIGRCYIGNIGFDIYGGAELCPTVLVLVDLVARGAAGAADAGGASGHAAGASDDGPPLVEPELPLVEPRVVADDLVVPNGAAVAPAGDRLIVAETMAQRRTSFRIAGDGSLDDRRLFADLGDESPDGICLDAEGGVWFASLRAHQVVRVEEGGRVTDRVSTGDRRALACALGGDDRRDLYVCATRTLDPEKSVGMRSGAIEVCRVDVAGAGLP
jgi:sugar lactone lactonase YvrE